MNSRHTPRTGTMICLALLFIIMAAPASAVIVSKTLDTSGLHKTTTSSTTKTTTTKSTSTSTSKTLSQKADEKFGKDGGFNPFRQSYTSSFTGNAGWKVATGKIDLGTPTSNRNLKYGKDQSVLSGLSGFVAEKGTLTLREKATIKHEKETKVAKYQNLVDFIKNQDANDPNTRRK